MVVLVILRKQGLELKILESTLIFINIQNWDVNLFNKFFDSIGPDDGLLATNISEESLQYVKDHSSS